MDFELLQDADDFDVEVINPPQSFRPKVPQTNRASKDFTLISSNSIQPKSSVSNTDKSPTSNKTLSTTRTSRSTNKISYHDDPNVDDTEDDAENDAEEYDLVIVGSGVSGLYALFTLLTEQPEYQEKRIKVIEQSGIIGGRLRTDIIKDSNIKSRSCDNKIDSSQAFVACEEGGMRFCLLLDDKNQIEEEQLQVMPHLADLIKKLQPFDEKMYKIERFKMVPDGKIDFRRQRYSGQTFTSWYADQNPGIWGNLFYLDEDECGRSPDAIYEEIYKKILKENYSRLIGLLGDRDAAIVLKQKNKAEVRQIQTTEYWYKFRKYFTWNNVPLYKFTMRSLMTVMGYSQGCIKMLERHGFQCFTMGRGNAGIIIQMSMSHEAMFDSFYCFTYGFGALIEALQAGINKKLRLSRESSDWVLLNNKATSLKLGNGSKKLGDDFTELTIEEKDVNGDVISKKMKARDLIMAIPRKSFESIQISRIPDKNLALFRSLLNSVVDVNMTKINLYFAEAWWNKNNNSRMYGCSTTDLPIAQVCWYLIIILY